MTTIYVAQPETELMVRSRQLQVFQQQRFCFAVPLSRVNQVIILGTQPWAQKAVNVALSLQIPVLYFEPDGRCIAYVQPLDESARYGSMQWARSQEVTFVRQTAESLVRAKLHNARVVLGRSPASLPKAVQHVRLLLQRLMDDLPLAPSLAALKTYDETGTSLYQAALHRCLPDRFRRYNRGLFPLRRLTDLGLALLSQRIQVVVQAAGLDPDIANLHCDAIERSPLVCDFLNELQVPLVDALVLELLTTEQISPDDFIWTEQGIFLSPSALDLFIQEWDAHLAGSMDHLYNGMIQRHQCIEVQVNAYVSALLEDEPDYRPLLLKVSA